MTARVPASDRTRKQIADVLSGDFDKSALLRNAVRLIIEAALEAEVMDVRGRAVTERRWEDYWAFAGRDLTRHPILYLFLDGMAERLHLGQPREPVLAAWGIAASGAQRLLGLYAAAKEDTASARECWRDLKARGMNEPILIATDGAPGLIRAVEDVFPQRLRQRCLAHKLRNLGAKVPEERGRAVKAHALAAYQALSPLAARAAVEALRRRYAREFPSAVACCEDDFEACIAHWRLPIAHRKAIRTTNLLERLFGEERRRTKTIPTLSANGPCSN